MTLMADPIVKQSNWQRSGAYADVIHDLTRTTPLEVRVATSQMPPSCSVTPLVPNRHCTLIHRLLSGRSNSGE